jgi:hypothetical protein
MIGVKLSPILVEIEDTLWEFEANIGSKPEYTTEGFRAATKIFMSALMDKMYSMQEEDGLSMDDRGKMAETVGNELRNMVKTYTGIDTVELYK